MSVRRLSIGNWANRAPRSGVNYFGFRTFFVREVKCARLEPELERHKCGWSERWVVGPQV
jgi:hypothetical protein